MQMPRPKPTIYSVAARAGVSISTVSLAINQPQRVSAATRKKVADAAEAEGYRSSVAGPRRGSRAIAVIAPFSAWPSYYTRLDGILEACSAAGVDVIVHDLPPSQESEAPLLDSLPVRGDLDGVIIMGRLLTDAAEAAILRGGTPTVLVDAQNDRLPTVLTDDRHGGVLLGEHLVALGHRQIVFAYEGPAWFEYSSSGLQRFHGLQDVLEAAGGSVAIVPFDDDLLEASRRLGATAVVANHDGLAVRIARQLTEAGIAIPAGLSLAGFDGGTVADALNLTTVEQPFAATGLAAANHLLGTLAGTAPQIRTTTLACRLLARGTTAPPAAR